MTMNYRVAYRIEDFEEVLSARSDAGEEVAEDASESGSPAEEPAGETYDTEADFDGNFGGRPEKKSMDRPGLADEAPSKPGGWRLNAELAQVWPNITEMKPALPDAEKWKEVANKRGLLQR